MKDEEWNDCHGVSWIINIWYELYYTDKQAIDIWNGVDFF